MAGKLLIQAFVSDDPTPRLTITYDRQRFTLTQDPPREEQFDRLEFYDGGNSPLLIVPVVKCRFTANHSPGTKNEWVAIEAQIRNVFDTRSEGSLDVSLSLTAGINREPPRFTRAFFQSSKVGIGGPAICNLLDPTRCSSAHNGPATIGEFVDLLSSGVTLRAQTSDANLLNTLLQGVGLNIAEFEIKRVSIGKRGRDLLEPGAQVPSIWTLQFSQMGALKQRAMVRGLELTLEQNDRIMLTQRPSSDWLGKTDGRKEQTWTLTADIPAVRAHQWWNEVVAQPYLDALLKIKAGAPMSAMPILRNGGSAVWRLAFRMREIPPSAADAPKPTDVALRPPILVPLGSDPLQIMLSNLKPHEGDLVLSGVAGPNGPTDPDELDISNRQPRAEFKFDINQVLGGDESKIVRLGAFDLQLGAAGKGLEASFFRAVMRSDQGSQAGLEQTSVICNLPLNDALPAGQDDLPASEFLPEGFSAGCPIDQNSEECISAEASLEREFRREPPLILQRPQEGSQQLPKSPRNFLWLNCSETTRSNTSQTIRLSLRTKPLEASDALTRPAAAIKTTDTARQDTKAAQVGTVGRVATSSGQDVLVLDRDPFLLAMVRYTPIRNLQNEVKDTQEIAWWSNASIEGAAWHVLSKFGKFELVLPPQVLGEAMLKGKELQENEIVPFRLAPPARQTLEASYTPQQFVEVPWNLRRLLGFAGQRDPGAGIVELQYELLYGLACVAAPSEMLRFAELFSTVGRIGGMLPPLHSSGASADDVKLVQTFRRQWGDLYRRYKSRLAVFEVRRQGANFGQLEDATKDPPQAFSLSDGVQCIFRSNASLYYPGWDQKPAGSNCNQGVADEFNVCSDGLKGGATWGFEAPRLYRATVRNPRSDSAVLTSPYFSSLGGWGFQKVTFDNHRSTVYSHTAMGRVFSYSLERIGRIANYGNLAKHVIQYERTVEPTAQFEADQTAMHRRPVVRKTHEFVEILESEAELRKPHEDPLCGFVHKIVFKTTIIPVLSEWGNNVGQTGWKVPLWNRAAALKNPTVYSMPEVVFEVANGTGTARGLCGILEPDKLFFYTDTQKDGSADPHEWPLVPWLDFPPLPQPVPRPAFTSNSTNEELHTDPYVAPGFRMFTYAVESLSGGLNLVDGRVEHAVAAVIQNVTIARSAVISTWDKDLEQAKKLIDLSQQNYAALQGKFAQGQAAAADITTFVTKICSDKAWTNAIGQVSKRIAQETATLMAQVGQRESDLINGFKSSLDLAISNLNEEIAAEFKDAWQPGTAPARQALIDLAKAETDFLRQRLNTLHGRIAGIRNALVQTRDALKAFKDDYQKEYQDGIQHLQDLVNQASIDLASLRVSFAVTVGEVQHRWAALHSQVSANFGSWIPSAGGLVDRILEPLETTFQQWVTEIDAELRRPDPKLKAAEFSDALNKLKEIQFPEMPAALDNPASPANQIKLEQDFAKELLDHLVDQIKATLIGLIPENPPMNPDALLKTVREKLAPEQIKTLIAGKLGSLDSNIKAQMEKATTYLTDNVSKLVTKPLTDFQNLVQSGCQVAPTRDAVTKFLKNVEHAAQRVFESATESLKNSLASSALVQAADTPIRMLRAFGKPPQLPNLDFSLPRLAYYYYPHLPTLDMTPVLTQVKQLGPALESIGTAINPLGTHLPSVKLLDRFIPPDLPKFDLSSIFPDFGGIKLDHLFPNLKMPLDSTDKVRISHGVDPAARTAWVAADVDFTADTTATLFSFGPMALSIPSARFKARVEMVASQRGIERRSSGNISGNWQLVFGGVNVVTLRDTALTFDNSGLHFNVAPERVELSGVLNFISSMLARVTSPGNGFTAGATPTGFEARLDLPIPDISLGTFGISNLSLHNSFALDVANEFKLKVGFALASRRAPFNLSIFILGGGGFIETSAEYTPSTGKLACAAHIGITASASLAISLGPIQGGVYAFVGITIDFEAGGSQSRGLAIGAMLLIRGQVSILSIVSAYVSVGLDLVYSSGQLVGHGFFSIEIKICWCFTLSVSQSITFTLGSSSGRSSLLQEPIYLASALPPSGAISDVSPVLFPADGGGSMQCFDAAADEYISMFVEDVAA